MVSRRSIAVVVLVAAIVASVSVRMVPSLAAVRSGESSTSATSETIAEKRRALDEAIAAEKAAPSKATALAVEAALADYNAAVSARAAALLEDMREIEAELAKPTPEGGVDTKVHSPARGDRRRALSARYDALRAEFVRVAARSTNVLGSTTETEPNDVAGMATPLDLSAACGIASGSISPAGDVDYYSFAAPAGAQIWAYVDTGGPTVQGSQSRDSLLTLYGTDGATELERDDEDGSGNGCDSTTESLSASAIAGHTVAGAGTYFLRVEDFPGVAQTIDPYRLYVVVTTGVPAAEAEPNDTGLQANALVPAGQNVGVRTGALSVSGDVDIYSIEVENGASLLYISADADPERDGIGTDVAIDLFAPEAGTLLFTSEGGVSLDALAPLGSVGGLTPLYTADSSDRYGAPAPPAEGFCFLAPSAGTYYVRVRSTNDEVGTYSLMAAATAQPPYGCPPLTVSGTLGSGSPDYPSQSGIQVGRLRRDGFRTLCGFREPCPGIFDPVGARRYDAYRFGNNSDETVCVTISVRSPCVQGAPVFAVVYSNSFNPDDLCENYVADSGLSVGPGTTFSFDVGPRASFVLVLHEVPTGSECADYQFSIAGLPGCVDPPSDLSVTLEQYYDPIAPGQEQRYTISVANSGPTTIEDVTLTIDVPAGTTFDSFYSFNPNQWTCTTPPSGGTGTITCSTPALLGGVSATFRLNVFSDASLPDGAAITATATVSTTSPDADPTNNSSTVSATVQHRADLGTYFNYPSVVPIGGEAVYGVAAYNDGPNAASNVVWTIPVPVGTTFQSFQSPPGWTCTTPPVGGTGNVVCTIPSFGYGAYAYAELTVKVDPGLPDGTQIVATTNIAASSPDPYVYNNQETVYSTAVFTVDLSIFVSQAPEPVSAGGTVIYDITVKNAGPGNASNVGVFNQLPYQTTFVSCEASDGGTCYPGGNVTTVGWSLIPAGGGATVRIVATVGCGVSNGELLYNFSNVGSSAFDIDQNNNYANTYGTVVALTPPTIACSPNVTAVANTPTGAVVTYPPPTVTPAGTPNVCSPLSGSFFPVGTTTVYCSAQDACGNQAVCSFTVTVNRPAFDLCAVDDVTGDYYKAVTAVPTSAPSYGYWEYHKVNGPGPADDQVFYGVANQVGGNKRLTTLEDRDDPTYLMTAVFNRRTGRTEVSVRILATGVRYRLVDANYFNSSCP